MDQDESLCGVEVFLSWTSWYWVRFSETGEVTVIFCFFYLGISLNFGLHLDIYYLILLKLGVMINGIELYILILV